MSEHQENEQLLEQELLILQELEASREHVRKLEGGLREVREKLIKFQTQIPRLQSA
jgi:hypothetical protein